MKSRIRRTLVETFDDDVAQQARLECLGGHASLRIYWRVHLPLQLSPPRAYPRGETTLMAMVLPEDADPFDSAEGLSDDAPTAGQMPFVEMQRYLADIGMPVPSIDTVDMDRGVLLLEDLGDRLFEHAVEEADDLAEIRELYRQAIDVLVKLQTQVHRRGHEYGDGSPCIGFERRFDRELLTWELEHFIEWGLEARLGEENVADLVEPLREQFERVVDELLALPQTLVLRDFQSRNIMFKQADWILIDFQDALVGPFVYDLVALLRDSYVELPDEASAPLVDYYADRCADEQLPWGEDTDAVHRAFHLQTVQRKLKDAGRFINIDRVKNDPSFLDYYAPSIRYVCDAVEQLDGFERLGQLLSRVE